MYNIYIIIIIILATSEKRPLSTVDTTLTLVRQSAIQNNLYKRTHAQTLADVLLPRFSAFNRGVQSCILYTFWFFSVIVHDVHMQLAICHNHVRPLTRSVVSSTTFEIGTTSDNIAETNSKCPLLSVLLQSQQNHAHVATRIIAGLNAAS